MRNDLKIGNWVITFTTSGNAPEELSDILVESTVTISAALSELREAVEVLHVKLGSRDTGTDLVEDEIKVWLFEVVRAVSDDLVDIHSHFSLGECPELLKTFWSKLIFSQ